MRSLVSRPFGISTAVLLILAIGWDNAQAEDASVAGAYSLQEVNGEPLPADLWTEIDGDRCKQVILKGVLLLDSEDRSAAFLTERIICPGESESEKEGMKRSVIFAGTYTVSGNRITVEDDFGTDEAVVEGDVLVYETGGEGRPIETFVFKRE